MRKIIHELRNKLTVLVGQSMKLSRKYGKEELTMITTVIDQMEGLIDQLAVIEKANQANTPTTSSSSHPLDQSKK